MTQQVTLDTAQATSMPERKGELRLLPVWSFIIVVGVVVIAALISDSSFTADQRLEVFQQSGIYP